MPSQPDPGDSPPSAGRKPRGHKQPGRVPTPHDSVFRRVFGVPANATSELRAVQPPNWSPGWTVLAVDPNAGSSCWSSGGPFVW
jgi:hypothetical protein